jgi:hypothetical protein
MTKKWGACPAYFPVSSPLRGRLGEGDYFEKQHPSPPALSPQGEGVHSVFTRVHLWLNNKIIKKGGNRIPPYRRNHLCLSIKKLFLLLSVFICG